MTAPLLGRLDARDRALLLRCVIAPTASRRSRLAWTVVTHLGGSGPTVAAAVVPWFQCCALHSASRLALATLVASHLVVQVIKRTVVRRRPEESGLRAALVTEPDRFSFPSGHAAAAMSVAVGYGVTFPALGLPLLVLAALVGFSRVRLGVHFPGDVLAGELIALTTGGLVLAFG
ncbi:MAG: phosphatase PAP2 family protein [Gemmatimonadales bacterium]